MKLKYLSRILFVWFLFIMTSFLFICLALVPYTAQQIFIYNATKEEVTGTYNYDPSTLRRYDSFDSKYYCIYSNVIVNESSDTYNIEHIFARSWADDDIKDEVANDAFNVRVADIATNSARGNALFATVEHNQSNEVLDSYGNVSGWLDTINNLFEPNDESKGDIARAIIYMVVKYDLKYEYIDTMIQWAKIDPPDEYEILHFKTANKLVGYSNIFIKKPIYIRYCI